MMNKGFEQLRAGMDQAGCSIEYTDSIVNGAEAIDLLKNDELAMLIACISAVCDARGLGASAIAIQRANIVLATEMEGE